MTVSTSNQATEAPTTRLEALLRRIGGPDLAEQLRTEMRARDKREFGPVFERHLPETVELTCDAPDRPWHTLINAENALQALQYTHAGQVDIGG